MYFSTAGGRREDKVDLLELPVKLVGTGFTDHIEDIPFPNQDAVPIVIYRSVLKEQQEQITLPAFENPTIVVAFRRVSLVIKLSKWARRSPVVN